MQKQNEHRTNLTQLVHFFETALMDQRPVQLEEEAYLLLLDHYQREFMEDRVLLVAEKACLQHPQSLEMMLRRIQLLLTFGKSEEAMAVLDEAGQADDHPLRLILCRAHVLAEMELFDAALSITENLKKDLFQPEELSQIHYYEALILEKMRAFDQMFYHLRESVLLSPENDEALEKLWWCVERAGTYQESIQLHQEITDRRPYAFWAWFNLANAYEYECNYEEAIEAYEFAMVINEDFEFAFRNCAELCFNTGRIDRALMYFQDVIDQFGPDEDVLLRIGMCHFRKQDPETALEYIHQALQLNDYNDEAHYYLGRCYLETGQMEKAFHHLEEALEGDPGREDYLFALAGACEKAGQFARARNFYREAAYTAPELSEYWIGYAAFLLRQGKIRSSMRVLKEAEENGCGMEIAYTRVACLIALGKKSEGLYYLRELLEEDPLGHEAIFSYMPSLARDADLLAVLKNHEYLPSFIQDRELQAGPREN